MSKVYFSFVVLAVALLSLGFAANVQAEFINGNFEDTTGWGAVGTTSYPAGWNNPDSAAWRNPAAIQTSPSPVIGGSVSAYMPLSTVSTPVKGLRQTLAAANQVANWVYEFDFASEDPGGATNRSLHFSMLIGGTTASYIRFIGRIVDADADGDGDLEIYDKNTPGYKSVIKDCIQFDADVQSAISVNHLKIVSHMELAAPKYDVYVTDSLGTTHSALGLAYWYSSAPSQNDKLCGAQFETESSSGDYLIDNVTGHTIPEPSTIALLASGLFGLLAYAWRKRK